MSSQLHGGNWMKRLAYWAVFTVAAVSLGAYLAREPWQKYQEERALARRANEDMEKAETERAELIKQRARYRSPAGREELLRESGYTKEGEVPLERR
jgi:hypothetical protein